MHANPAPQFASKYGGVSAEDAAMFDPPHVWGEIPPLPLPGFMPTKVSLDTGAPTIPAARPAPALPAPPAPDYYGICRTCDRPMRANHARAEDWPGAAQAASKIECMPCRRIRIAQEKYPDLMRCQDCRWPVRKSGVRAHHFPGTKARGSSTRCITCQRRHREQEQGGPARPHPMELPVCPGCETRMRPLGSTVKDYPNTHLYAGYCCAACKGRERRRKAAAAEQRAAGQPRASRTDPIPEAPENLDPHHKHLRAQLDELISARRRRSVPAAGIPVPGEDDQAPVELPSRESMTLAMIQDVTMLAATGATVEEAAERVGLRPGSLRGLMSRRNLTELQAQFVQNRQARKNGEDPEDDG